MFTEVLTKPLNYVESKIFKQIGSRFSPHPKLALAQPLVPSFQDATFTLLSLGKHSPTPLFGLQRSLLSDMVSFDYIAISKKCSQNVYSKAIRSN